MRTFKTGATRNDDSEELDYTGFLSPKVLQTYAKYMHENRKQADGKLRSGDNWKKGIALQSYMTSMHRHFMDVWLEHEGEQSREGMEKGLCGLLFNVMGYMHELEKQKKVLPSNVSTTYEPFDAKHINDIK